MQRSWRLFYQNFIFGPKKVEIFLRCKLVIGYNLNKLESYSRISDLGPVGHCTSHFKRAVCMSCQPCVDVHKGPPMFMDACGQGEGQKRDFFVDVKNGWPLWG